MSVLDDAHHGGIAAEAPGHLGRWSRAVLQLTASLGVGSQDLGVDVDADQMAISGAPLRRTRCEELALVAGGVGLSRWGAGEADRRASARQEQIRAALAGETPQTLRLDGVSSAFGDLPELPGGP